MPSPAPLLFSLFAVLAVLPGGFAGPACTKKYYQANECISKCGSKWGYPGAMMGGSTWGNVMQTVDPSPNAWAAVISKACGLATVGDDGADKKIVAGAVGQDPSNGDEDEVEEITDGDAQESDAPVVTNAFAPSITVSTSSSSSTPSTTSTTSTSPPPPTSTAVRSTSTPRPSPSSTPRPTPTPTPEPVKSTPKTTPPAPKPTTTKAAPAPDPTPDAPSQGVDIDLYLSEHNNARARHGAKPLTWSANLASKAQQWANNCVFEHSGGSLGRFGENLAAGTSSTYSITNAMKAWMDEVSEYNPSSPKASHFTQVVWKDTTSVGCAVQSCSGILGSGKARFYVCEYDPPGNFNNDFANNVQV